MILCEEKMYCDISCDNFVIWR